jgi:hypothetical protein
MALVRGDGLHVSALGAIHGAGFDGVAALGDLGWVNILSGMLFGCGHGINL